MIGQTAFVCDKSSETVRNRTNVIKTGIIIIFSPEILPMFSEKVPPWFNPIEGHSVPEGKSLISFVFGFAVYESFESPQTARTGIIPMPEKEERNDRPDKRDY